MKSRRLLLAVAICGLLSVTVNAQQIPNKTSFELSEIDKRLLNDRIARILEKDQQFRSYLSYHTTDDEKIAELNKLDAKGMMEAMTQNKGALSAETTELLKKLQLKNDKENLKEFLAIIEEYGYPSAERLGVKADKLFVLLLHPPVEKGQVESHTKMLCEKLLPEVKAGRMKPKLYAMFVDNMRGKILRLPQIYGTNQQYDRATGKILPPKIEDLDKANRARQEIGMPELKDGEYRLASASN